MKKISYIFVLSLLAFCCSRPAAPPPAINKAPFPDLKSSTLYIIKAGNHYSEQNFPQILNRNGMAANITFDSSAIYTSVDANNQADVNKLMGFSDCGTDHQQNSARLGWSWTGEQLMLYAYAYVNKVRIIKTLGGFALNTSISCSIKAVDRYYYFQAGKVIDSIPRFCSDFNGSRYKLFPYFGGDETAPHDVTILIKED